MTLIGTNTKDLEWPWRSFAYCKLLHMAFFYCLAVIDNISADRVLAQSLCGSWACCLSWLGTYRIAGYCWLGDRKCILPVKYKYNKSILPWWQQNMCSEDHATDWNSVEVIVQESNKTGRLITTTQPPFYSYCTTCQRASAGTSS